MTTKRIIRKFTLDHIAAVDTPAQEGAKLTIIKRHEPMHPAVEALGKTLDGLIAKAKVGKAAPITRKLTDDEIAGLFDRMAKKEQALKQELDDMKRDDANALIKSAGDIWSTDQAKVTRKKDEKPLTRVQAVHKARQENPEGYAAMNSLPSYTFTGRTGTDVVKQQVAFDTLTTQIKLRERCTHAEAMQKAYAQVQKAFAKGEPELGEFEQLVAGIQKSRGSSRAEALRQARRENPEAFAEWQG